MSAHDDAELARRLKVYILPWLHEGARGAPLGGGGGAAPAPAPSPAPAPGDTGQYLLTTGQRPLVGSMAVADGVQIDGVDLSAFWAAYEAHRQNPSAHHAAFVGLRDGGGGLADPDPQQRVAVLGGPGLMSVAGPGALQVAVRLASPSGLAFGPDSGLALDDAVAGTGLSIFGKQLAVNAALGLETQGDAVILSPPATLSVFSLNSNQGAHSHAVASSSSPGPLPSLLATGPGGRLQIWELVASRGDPGVALLVENGGNALPALAVRSGLGLGFSTGRAVTLSVFGEREPRLALYTQGWLGLGAGDDAPMDVVLSRRGARTALLSGDGVGTSPANLMVGGWMKLGDTGVALSPAALDIRHDAEHIRLRHQSRPETGYSTLAVDASGSLSAESEGVMYVYPKGQALMPTYSYHTDLGSLQRKWRAIYGAELQVETLVAQQTIATIGGRVLVGPGTTALTRDLPASAGRIVTRHNNLAIGDTVYLEGNGQVEFLSIIGTRSNLLRNPSFESWDGGTSTTSWEAFGLITLTDDTNAPVNGRVSLHMQ